MNRQNPIAKAVKATSAVLRYAATAKAANTLFSIRHQHGVSKSSLKGGGLTYAKGAGPLPPTHPRFRHSLNVQTQPPGVTMHTKPVPDCHDTPIEALAAQFYREVIDEVRLSVALRRAYPGAHARARPAITSGPGAGLTLLVMYPPGEGLTVRAVPTESLDQLRSTVSDEEALAELGRRARAGLLDLEDPLDDVDVLEGMDPLV